MTKSEKSRLEWEIKIIDQICKEGSGYSIKEYYELLDELDMIHKAANKQFITDLLIKKVKI